MDNDMPDASDLFGEFKIPEYKPAFDTDSALEGLRDQVAEFHRWADAQKKQRMIRRIKDAGVVVVAAAAVAYLMTADTKET